MFSASASCRRFHLLIGTKEPATLVQNIAISLICVDETTTIKA